MKETGTSDNPTASIVTVEVPAAELYKLEEAMLRLICEAIHYKDAGKGKEFLEKAIKRADELLSDWKQNRPAGMTF